MYGFEKEAYDEAYVSTVEKIKKNGIKTWKISQHICSKFNFLLN